MGGFFKTAVTRTLRGLRNPSVDAQLRTIGLRIAELRRGLDLTQEEFSAKLRLSLKYVQRIEAGRHNLSVGSLVKLAGALGVAVPELFRTPKWFKRNRGRPKGTKNSASSVRSRVRKA